MKKYIYLIAVLVIVLTGCNSTSTTSESSSEAKVSDTEVEEITEGRFADKVFDTAGSTATIKQTAFLAKRGGTVTLVGISTHPEIEYNFGQVMDKELTIKSVFRYRNLYPRAIAAVSSGAINVKGIVTHVFDFDHIQDAYDEAVNNKTDLVKAVIKVK